MAEESQENNDKKAQSKRGRSKKSSRVASSDIEEMLVDGERIVAQGVISSGIYWKAIAVIIISILVALIAIPIGVVLALAALAMFIFATLKKEILLFVLTDRRIFVRYGILQIDVVDIRFDKIESIELERMLPGYLMGYANLVVMGTGNRYIVIPYVGNAIAIRRAYNKITLEEPEAPEAQANSGRRVSGQVQIGGRRASDPDAEA